MKYGRHILFWFVYCCYFYVQSIAPQTLDAFQDPKTYQHAFISLYSFIPVCVMSVYISLYVILPRFIETKKYVRAIISFIVLFSIATFINYFAARLYYYVSEVWTTSGKGSFFLGYLNTVWAMIISGIAICIKITMKWINQQKEIEAITKQKARNELNLQKNRMQPRFLYSSLDCIHTDLKENTGDSSRMVLMLSNLLSYSLYECKKEKVTLHRELTAVSEYISLERMKGLNDIALHVDGNIEAAKLLVPPMFILDVLHEDAAESVTVHEYELTLKIDISVKDGPDKRIVIEKIHKQEYEPA